MSGLYLGNCVEGLAGTEAASLDLTVTSPPWGSLRPGFAPLTRAVFDAVSRELYRTTKTGGIVCWHEGDQIVGNPGQRGESGLSWRHALSLQGLGFTLHQTLVTGSTGQRYPAPRRYAPTIAYVFVLSKGTPKTVNLLRRRNKNPGVRFRSNERLNDGTLRVRNKDYFVSENGTKGPFWLYDPVGSGTPRTRHPAPMNAALARDLILSYSEPQDLVCDPFAGSCTTGARAVLLGRRFVGWEIDPTFHALGVDRLNRARTQRVRDLLDGLENLHIVSL